MASLTREKKDKYLSELKNRNRIYRDARQIYASSLGRAPVRTSNKLGLDKDAKEDKLLAVRAKISRLKGHKYY